MGEVNLQPGWLAESLREAALWEAQREAEAAHKSRSREIARGQAIIDAAEARLKAADAALADAELAVRTHRAIPGIVDGPKTDHD